MKKKIVLFALSWRNQDVCVAGKDLFTKEWIRPVTEAGPVPKSDVYKFRLGDIVEVEVSSHCPKDHQTENYRLVGNSWRKTGVISLANLPLYLDNPPNIWDYKTSIGAKSVPFVDIATAGINKSLYLISVPDLTVDHVMEQYSDGTQKPKYYGTFQYSGVKYKFSITDPVFILKYPNFGTYSVSRPTLCLSLAEPWASMNNRCYKLIAGVIV